MLISFFLPVALVNFCFSFFIPTPFFALCLLIPCPGPPEINPQLKSQSVTYNLPLQLNWYKTVKGNGKQLFRSWLQINLNSSLFLYLEFSYPLFFNYARKLRAQVPLKLIFFSRIGEFHIINCFTSIAL